MSKTIDISTIAGLGLALIGIWWVWIIPVELPMAISTISAVLGYLGGIVLTSPLWWNKQ